MVRSSTVAAFGVVALVALIGSCGAPPTTIVSAATPTALFIPLVGKPAAGPTLAGCPMFPPDNPWNRDVSADAVDPNSAAYISTILADNSFLHPDFGGGGVYGIPYTTVEQNQPLVPVSFDYADESDAGPYPIPPNAPIEQGGDRHVLVVQKGSCKLYELYAAERAGAGWQAGSGAIFDLNSNALRPDGWTSADAAGLPILAGLARYDEVAAGEIRHALRFTVERSQRAYIHPATHYASSLTDTSLPPMGLRLRLKASFDTSRYTGQSRVILEALKRYGMIVADNGSSWFISGASDPRWDDDDLEQIKRVPGSAFEVVKAGTIYRP